jgi:hypothetical protein
LFGKKNLCGIDNDHKLLIEERGKRSKNREITILSYAFHLQLTIELSSC